LETDRNKLILGRREYELANHLGNVLATVSDAKLPAAKVLSHTDYYAFGGAMPGRSGGSYRYGFNTQEKSPELAEGHYTAEFWEYDARIGRRWNVDPRPTVGISEYVAFANSPLMFSDVKGDSAYSYSRAMANRIVSDLNTIFKFKYRNQQTTPFLVRLNALCLSCIFAKKHPWYVPYQNIWARYPSFAGRTRILNTLCWTYCC
jgi:RHS repeat-associated protein